MSKHTVLPLLLTALLAAPMPARSAEDPAKPKAAAKKPAGKGGAQSAASYMPKVKAVLAKRWAETIAARMADFSTGNLTVAFKLDAEGKVTDFAVAENTSNEAFAKFCEQLVRETIFEKPPAGLLKDGLLEIPFTFTIL